MRILLIRPPRRKNAISLGDFMFAEPIGLECVYDVLKDRHEVKILDLMGGTEDFREECISWQPEVVGFTALCINVLSVLELAEEAKDLNKGIITVVGGTQAFLSPESFFRAEVDHVMKFTTVKNLNQLFKYLEKGAKVPLIDGVYSKENGFNSTGVDGFNDYIVPDRTSTEKYRKHYTWFGYAPCAILQTSRGCSSCCTFCLRWQIEGRREKDEPLENVIKQIQEIEELNIMIIDNDFLHNRQRLEKFCDLLEACRIQKNFLCYGSVESIIQNYSIVKRLADNGLKAVIVGYESFSDTDLESYNKNATVKKNITAGKILKEFGIDCWASFILHPDWSVCDFKELRKYMKKLKPEIAALTPLTLYSNSPLYEEFKERLLYSYEDYDQWSFSIVTVAPSKMSLRRYYYEVLKTNLFVNVFINNPIYKIKKFGYGNFFRILKGSWRFILTYFCFMLKDRRM